MLAVTIAAGAPAHLAFTTDRGGEGGFALPTVLEILGCTLRRTTKLLASISVARR
jgi:hypothetical protein